MKRIKILRIVFIILNVLNVIAAVGLMIQSNYLPKPYNWNPPIWFRSAVFCIPALIIINFVWLMVWLFMTNRIKIAFFVLNTVTLTVTVFMSIFTKISYDNQLYTPEQPIWVYALKYCIPFFIVINVAWLIVTLVRRRKQKSNSLGKV